MDESCAASVIQSRYRRYVKKKRENDDLLEFESTINNLLRVNKVDIIADAKRKIQKNYPGIRFKQIRQEKNSCLITVENTNITRTCPISMRIHNSNHIFFTVSFLTRSVQVRCYKCKQQFREITSDTNMYKSICGDVVASTKVSNKRNHDGMRLRVPTLKDVEHIKFNDTIINMGTSDVFDLYENLQFVWVPAKKKEKRPVRSAWTESTLEDNEKINMEHNNVAILTGKKSNIVVIDCDVKDRGVEYFQSLCSQNKYNYAVNTMTVRTPSGGIHVYYKYDESLSKNHGRLSEENGNLVGIDIRSNNGCVIGPPSKYDNGPYAFISCKRPSDLPEFLVNLFSKQDQ